MSVAEASLLSTLSVRTLKADIAAGKLKVCRKGRRIIIPLENLEKYITH
jgi:hypothetical protein